MPRLRHALVTTRHACLYQCLCAQLAAAEGKPDANALGWAARDSGAVLSPYKFTRRELQPNDVFIKITHAGMCHSDLHTINGDWGPAKYPVVPGCVRSCSGRRCGGDAWQLCVLQMC
jgi:hypothetical protein